MSKIEKGEGRWESMVLIGIIIAVVYWFLDSFLLLFISSDSYLFSGFLGEETYEVLTRLIALCLFIIFGSHVQYTINNRKKAEKALIESYKNLHNARITTILGLAKLAESRDQATGSHLERMQQYSKLLAEALAKNPKYNGYITADYIDSLYNSSVLHDIGKVGVPDSILLKPAKLNKNEFELIKMHTTLGGDAIKAIESKIEGRSFLRIGKEVAYHHHEKWDGTGYPFGLKAEAIPLSARIVALADHYDALTSKRPYKEALSHEKTVEIIKREKGSHFDPDIVDAFLSLQAEFNAVRAKMQTDNGHTVR
ncbi:MAG: HD domain-containing phosphohydrolase [Thermodesulfobacteriota bacterium]|nr:HD domain-containing phosphohydrolase [Thermodesulfobacteriota bacterium]